MSRIGKAPVDLPKGVEVKVNGQDLVCKGPKGSLTVAMGTGISAKIEGAKVTVERAEDT